MKASMRSKCDMYHKSGQESDCDWKERHHWESSRGAAVGAGAKDGDNLKMLNQLYIITDIPPASASLYYAPSDLFTTQSSGGAIAAVQQLKEDIYLLGLCSSYQSHFPSYIVSRARSVSSTDTM
jgi:hypothetical protein